MSDFEDKDLSSWDVSKVTTMSNIFKNCTSFNQSINPLSFNWDDIEKKREQFKKEDVKPERVESDFFSKWAFYSFTASGIGLIIYQVFYLAGFC